MANEFIARNGLISQNSSQITGSLTQGAAGNKALGVGSHAEGQATHALGNYSHAEGYVTSASGNWSHAEGYGTVALFERSHAEGYLTLTSGIGSHAEGYFTTASGYFSHAEGGWNDFDGIEFPGGQAIGGGSHAEGFGTIAVGNASHVQGLYNITSTTDGAFIHGNGIDDSNRSNLIYAAGTEVQITGSLYVTGSTVITGSVRGQVSVLSIASNTASLDLGSNNFFTLSLVDGANTHVSASNLQPGQTVNLRVSQSSAGTGTVSFNSAIEQASDSFYTGSMIANAEDIVTFISFNSSRLYMSAIRNLI